LSLLRSLLVFVPLIYGYTAVLGTISLLCSLFDREGRMQHTIARLWSRMILGTILSPVTIEGLRNADRSRACIYACNHLSALDIPIIYANLPVQFRILAKKELFRYPFLGWHLKRSGQIAVDVKDIDAKTAGKRPAVADPASPDLVTRGKIDRAAIRSIVETLHGGKSIVIFPEGGRSKTGQIKRFMSGAFYFAIKAQVDVVPMAIVGSFEVLPMNGFHVRPAPMELLIGKPISTAGLTARDIDALAARVQREVEELYYSRAQVVKPATTQEQSVSIN
jgi:1-acyl-sn-glycerol-3-phosphate acyltransferase